MRTESEVRERLDQIVTALKSPAAEGLSIERAKLEVRVDTLRWVLERWPYTHAFQPWEARAGVEARPWCALCGRDPEDPLHLPRKTDDAA